MLFSFLNINRIPINPTMSPVQTTSYQNRTGVFVCKDCWWHKLTSVFIHPTNSVLNFFNIFLITSLRVQYKIDPAMRDVWWHKAHVVTCDWWVPNLRPRLSRKALRHRRIRHRPLGSSRTIVSEALQHHCKTHSRYDFPFTLLYCIVQWCLHREESLGYLILVGLLT